MEGTSNGLGAGHHHEPARSSADGAERKGGVSQPANVESADTNKQRRLPRPIRYDGTTELASTEHEAPVRDELPSGDRTLGFFSFRSQPQAELKWLIDGLVYSTVTGMTGAFAKTGKTQVTMRMLISMLTQEHFLKWKVNPRATQEKILFLSLEMNDEEMTYMLNNMTDLDPTQHGVLEEQLMIRCGLSQNWQDKKGQDWILEYVRSTGATGLVIDALGSITSGSINEDTTVRQVFDFVSSLKQQLSCWVWIIHHTRKRTNEGKPHPPTIDDFYGSQYVAGRIRSSLALHKANDEGLLLVSTPANSLVREVEPFYIQRTDELDFKLSEQANGKAKAQNTLTILTKEEDKPGWGY